MTDTEIETMRGWARQLAEGADGGALSAHIVMPAEWATVFDSYMAGDALAGRLAECLMEMTAGRHTDHGREPRLCACCHRPLEAPEFTVVVVTTEKLGGPRITTAICVTCAPDRAAVQRRIGPGLAHLLSLLPDQQRRVHAGGSA